MWVLRHVWSQDHAVGPQRHHRSLDAQLSEQSWARLDQDEGLMEQLRTPAFCAISFCLVYEALSHRRLHHFDLVEHTIQESQKYAELQVESPCRLCHRDFQANHTCLVAWNIELYCLARHGTNSTGDCPDEVMHSPGLPLSPMSVVL